MCRVFTHFNIIITRIVHFWLESLPLLISKVPKVIVTFDYLIKYTADKKNLCFKLPRYICDLFHLIVYHLFCYSPINLKLFLIFNF